MLNFITKRKMCSKNLGKATDRPTCQASFSEKMSPLRGLAFVHFITPRAGARLMECHRYAAKMECRR
jgi:hypothetical protein